MNIGIASPIDIRIFLPFFKNKNEADVINTNFIASPASAVSTLAQSFLKAGHQIIFFTLSPNAFTIVGDRVTLHGVKYFNSYPIKYLWGDFINAKKIKSAIKQNIESLDVLHAHWTYAYAYAVSAFTKQLPVFCTVRDWASYIWKMESTKNKITWSFRCLMNEMVFRNQSIHFIANSPYTAELIKRKYAKDVSIILNPIKESFLCDNERVTQNHLKILCVSSSNNRGKNVKTLLLSFQRLCHKYPEAHLTLIGPPFVEESSIIKKWKKQKLLRNVTIIGSVNHDELKYYYNNTLIFVNPSLEETFGNTLLEAMACKVPIVAGRNSGAIPYILENGITGFLCDVRDVNSLADKIVEVYLDPNKAKKVTDNAFSVLKSTYTISIIREKHLELYESIRFLYEVKKV